MRVPVWSSLLLCLLVPSLSLRPRQAAQRSFLSSPRSCRRRATVRSALSPQEGAGGAFLKGLWTRVFSRGELPLPAERDCDVIIVGGGMAGLTCAKRLVAEGRTVKVLESGDDVGGRVRSDVVDGFILDRGFQVFIEKYPEALKELDYDRLKLRSFEPGAVVRRDGAFCTVSDPFRRPIRALSGVTAPIGTLVDKVLVAYLSLRLQVESIGEILGKPEVDTEEYLRFRRGFSPLMVEAFFRPFLSGIFLAPLTLQSSRMFEFVFKMFSEGAACLPEDGMGAIPRQIADDLPRGSVLLDTPVQAVDRRGAGVQLANGTLIAADAVVIATEAPAAVKLLRGAGALREDDDGIDLNVKGRASTCLYFDLPGEPPVKEPVLLLNGESNGGLVNNVCFPNAVSPTYAPPGRSLCSVTVVGMPPAAGGGARGAQESLEAQAREELGEWFGRDEVAEWKLLRIYTCPYSQPAQIPPNAQDFARSAEAAPGLFICGDHRDTPTLNGAILSGKKAADAVLAALKDRGARPRAEVAAAADAS